MTPPAVPRDQVSAELTSLADGEARSANLKGGQMHWSGTPPGRHALKVMVDEQVVYEEVLDLRPGANCWPAGGGRLDLRSCARAIFVRVVAADGSGPVDGVRRAAVAAAATPPENRNSWPFVQEWLAITPRARDLLLVARGFVPLRLRDLAEDTEVSMQPGTLLQLHVPEGVGLKVVVVEDPVRDPLLRAFDDHNLHGERELTGELEPLELSCLPGTILEVREVLEAGEGPPRRIAVGCTSPQEFRWR